MSIVNWLQGLFGHGQQAENLKRPWGKALVFTDQREERLTRKLARVVGCSPEQALHAVRREVSYAPNQSDETLLKRAVYHYRQELPESTCHVYQDQVPD